MRLGRTACYGSHDRYGTCSYSNTSQNVTFITLFAYSVSLQSVICKVKDYA